MIDTKQYLIKDRYEISYSHKHNGSRITVKGYGKIKRYAYADFMRRLRNTHPELKSILKEFTLVEVEVKDLLTNEVGKGLAQIYWKEV